MARFSRLPVLGQAAVLALALMLTQRPGARGRGTVHLLPVLMTDSPLRPPLPDDETRTLERAAPDTSAPRGPRREPSPPRRTTGRPGDSGARATRSSSASSRWPSASCSNAPGIHKSAYNQPDGWQRDVALAFTGPLADVSDALLLDRPRKGVQALVGRSDEDEIDTDLGLPAPAPSRTPTGATSGRPDALGRTGRAEASGAEEARVLAEAEAAPLDRRRLARDHPGLRDPPRRRVEPRDRVGGRRRRADRDRPRRAPTSSTGSTRSGRA